tara:strand:+ start:522 stop:791 length:270 start_codon:yes stop_codon:yes gene_type:complete
MFLEIALGACTGLLLTSLYVNWNLLKKNELLEDMIDSTADMVEATYRGMKKIDSTGHFESDDEIGSVFDGIKLTIENLNNYVKGEDING